MLKYNEENSRQDEKIRAKQLREKELANLQTMLEMLSEDRYRITELENTHKKRLHLLELQEAMYGVDVSPAVKIEIDDIRAKIKTISEHLIQNRRQIQQAEKRIRKMEGGRFFTLEKKESIDNELHGLHSEVEISFTISNEQYNDQLLDIIIRSIAAIIDISPDKITIEKISQGSIVIVIRLPETAADKLIDIYTSNLYTYMELKIAEFIVNYIKPVGGVSDLLINNFSKKVEISIDMLIQREQEKLLKDLLGLNNPDQFQNTRKRLEQKTLEEADRISKELINRNVIQQHLCSALEQKFDVYTIARSITPILVKLIADKKISIPFHPIFFASLALHISKIGVSNVCSRHKTFRWFKD